MFCSIAAAAWVTHILEGIVCFAVAIKYGLSMTTALAWFVDASLIGAGATTILFSYLRLGKSIIVGPLCIGSFIAIFYTSIQLWF